MLTFVVVVAEAVTVLLLVAHFLTLFFLVQHVERIANTLDDYVYEDDPDDGARDDLPAEPTHVVIDFRVAAAKRRKVS